VPPQRRNPGTGGPRRRPKIAGTGRAQGPAGAARPTAPTARPAAPGQDASAPKPEVGESVVGAGTPEGAAVELSKKPEPETTDEAVETPESAEATESAESTEAAESTGTAEAAAVPAEPEPGREVAPEDAAGTEPTAQSGTRPLLLLGGAAVALGVFAVVAAFQPGAKVENRAWVDTAATAQVERAATEAIETMHGYNYETIDDNFAAIRKLLTPEMQEQFDRTAEVTKQAAVQTHTVTQVDVTHIGVSMLDDSRAEVAAYINVSATGDGIAQGSAAAPLRVRMERIDGRWLVSELTDS